MSVGIAEKILSDIKKSYDEDIITLAENYLEWDQQLRNCLKEIDDLTDELDTMEGNFIDSETEFVELLNKVKNLEDHNTELTEENESLSDYINNLELDVTSLEEEVQSLSLQLANLEQ